MQENRDYIMIQIEELGSVLGKILSELLGLKSEGNESRAYSFVQERLINEIELDIELLLNSSNDSVKNLIEKKLYKHPYLYGLLANIFMENAETVKNKKKQKDLYSKALILFTMQAEESETYSHELQTKLNKIQDLIDDKS